MRFGDERGLANVGRTGARPVTLREALLDITKQYTGLAVGEQVAAVRTLAEIGPHSIRAIRTVDLHDVRSWRFNCHAFTFGLWQRDEFWRLQDTHPDAWPDGVFVVRHLLQAMSSVPPAEVPDEVAVLYFEGDQLKHSGLQRRESVQSKWGDCHTWEHGLFEVPASYGERVAFYVIPPVDVVVDAYVRFATAA